MALTHKSNVVEMPLWYQWLGTRVVTDPYSCKDIDLFELECEEVRLTHCKDGDRLCCEFVARRPDVPVTSFFDAARRVWIHIRRGGDYQTGGAESAAAT